MDHAVNALEGVIDKYQTAPWDEFCAALAAIYIAGATEALAGQWRTPEELDEYDCDRFFTKIAVKYKTTYNGSKLTITTINDVNQWTDDLMEYHKNDMLLTWMPIPELPDR